MIDIAFSNGKTFVWRADDWIELRQHHRIIGALIGCLSKLPRQEILHGLPMLLMPEEVTFLLEKKIARLIEIPNLKIRPNEELKKEFESYRNKLFNEQEQCLKEERKKQIIGFMDKIIEGKKRKILGLKTSKKQFKNNSNDNTVESIDKVEIDREALLAEELQKIPKLERTEALVQIHTAYPWFDENDIKKVSWNYPQSLEEQLRYQVYKDLRERGFFVTYGEKFGGDFLAYPGDPIMFHSQFIITCKNVNEDISILELSAQCRVACNVRKTQVYAYFADNPENLVYQSFYFESMNLA